jgi:2'-5' RNA ligase
MTAQNLSFLVSFSNQSMDSDRSQFVRSFIAIDLSSEVLSQLAKVSFEFEQTLQVRLDRSMKRKKSVRWVSPQNIHLTLKFLGDVLLTQLPELEKALRSCFEGDECFDISIGGLGVFPKIERPNVIWIGVKGPDALGRMVQKIEDRLAEYGFEKEKRPFTAHLTLGRVARDITQNEIRVISDTLNEFQAKTHKVEHIGSSHVDAVYLYRSNLQPAGPVYTRLLTIPLKEIKR